jgi:hypothetical protein
MKKHLLFSILPFAVIFTSCAASLSKAGDYGTISIALGGSQKRALESGWVGGVLPVFGSVTVKVSGGDMSDVTVVGSPSSTNITLQVPAGSNRLVQVSAVPAVGSTAPAFATAYGGSATVDVKEQSTTSIPIKLALSATKIFIPDCVGDVFKTADSLSGSVSASSIPYEPGFICYALDGYGRLYLPVSQGFARYSDLSETSAEYIELEDFTPGNIEGMAYSPADDRLYYVLMGETSDYNLAYIDTRSDAPTQIDVVLPSEYAAESGWSIFPPLATDRSGNLYLTAYQNDTENETKTYRLLKIAVGPPYEGKAVATVTAHAEGSVYGVQYAIQDGVIVSMTVQDTVLYLAVISLGDGESAASRGKVVAVDTGTLLPKWETGWSAEPFPTSPMTQFYGPVCFVGFAPGKLYVADDGFAVNGDEEYISVNRVLEIDTETETVSGVGLQGVSEFLQAEMEQPDTGL